MRIRSHQMYSAEEGAGSKVPVGSATCPLTLSFPF